MNLLRHVLRLAVSVLLLLQISCTQSATSKSEIPEFAVDTNARGGEVPESRTTKAAEESNPAEISDLDRSVEDLFNTVCSHSMKAAECDECRYEIGVVKASASLFEGGLLRLETAMKERIAVPLLLTGEVQFDERRVTHVNTQAEGIIRSVHVSFGARVRKGQALLEIESVAIGEAEGAYLEAAAVLRLSRSNHEREAELRKKGLLSEKEYQESRQDLETAEIRAESALGKIARLGMSLSDAKALNQSSATGRVVLRSPVDGTLLSLNAVSGQVARIEESLATIGDNSAVWVWADLHERDIAKVTQKQHGARLSAIVSVKAYPQEEFPGTVESVSPAMEEATRTVKLRIDVGNSDGRLLAGMFADVKILLPGDKEALGLPKSAVMEDESRSFVFIHHAGEYYVRRPVTVGRSWGGRTEVLAGLAGGEAVVTEGAFLMKSDVLRSKMGAGCAD